MPGTLTANTMLTHYRILSPLGAGGMGEVWVAEDTKLERKVALKLLPAQFTQDADRVRRFIREAKAASALNHPNIITIYEIGQASIDVGNAHFIATEFIEGQTLRRQMSSTERKLGLALDVAIQVASALSAAHAAGIVHRDIKPENIMVRPDGLVKVLDFGLAKLTEAHPAINDTNAPTLIQTTDPGMVMGTARYMSPEQARGLGVDQRSDLFSLGVVLYEVVAGRAPFTGTTIADVLVSILRTEPVPLAQYSSDLPPEFERIVSRCLKKDRALRYSSAQELLTDLKSLGSALSQPQPAQTSSPSIAVLPFVNMSADAENEYFCDGLAEELLNALAKIEVLRVAARTSAFSFKGKETDVREIGRKLNVMTVLEGGVRKSGNRLRITAQLINVADGYHLWSERYDREMKDIFDIQDEISLSIMDALKVRLLGAEKAAVLKRHTENTEAYQLYLKGRYFFYRFPEPGYEKAREYFQQSIDLDPTFALSYCGLADYFGFAACLGLMPPDEGFPKSEAVKNNALALDDGLAEVYATQAGIGLYYYRDWPAAEHNFKRSIELNPNYAEGHRHFAICLALFGRTEQALAEMRRALQLDSLSVGVNHWLGQLFFWLGRYDEAIEQYRRTLELDPSFAFAHELLGDAYEQKGQHAEAVAAWGHSLVLQGNVELSALLDRTFAASGSNAAVHALALKRLEHLNERKQRGAYVPAMEFVAVYLRLGDREQTATWLSRAVQERNGLVLVIQIDPRYEILRSDPQFVGLARQLGFTH